MLDCFRRNKRDDVASMTEQATCQSTWPMPYSFTDPLNLFWLDYPVRAYGINKASVLKATLPVGWETHACGFWCASSAPGLDSVSNRDSFYMYPVTRTTGLTYLSWLLSK